MEYYGIMPERKLWIKVAVVIFAIYTIYSSIANRNLFYLPFGVIMIFATFSNRKHIISQEGVDILYTICGAQFHNRWSWNEIENIHTDSITSKPNVELHFGKGMIGRRFILSKENSEKVLTIAKKINSKIYILEIKRKNRE